MCPDIIFKKLFLLIVQRAGLLILKLEFKGYFL